MKYVIIAECNGVPYYVKLKNSTPELRGLKDHATEFDQRDSAEFWKRHCQTRLNNPLRVEPKDKN